MVFVFQQVTDGCALSVYNGPGPTPQGRQAPSHPARSEQSRASWGGCEVSQRVTPPSPSASQGTCTAEQTPMSVGSPRGGDDPAPGIPGFSTIALVKWAGRVQGRQEEVWPCRARGWEGISEQWRLGGEKGTVLAVATVKLWCSWSQAEEPEALHGPRPAQPGRWLVHTSMKAAIKPHGALTTSQMKSVGRGVAGRDCTHAYQDISTHLQASSALDTKDFEADPVCQGSEGGGEKGTYFWGKYQLPLFHERLLLSWHCVLYIFSLTRCPLLCKIYTRIERLWNTQGNNFSVDWVLNGKTSLNAILQIRRSPAF